MLKRFVAPVIEKKEIDKMAYPFKQIGKQKRGLLDWQKDGFLPVYVKKMQENEGKGIIHLSAATNSAKTSGTLACGVEGFKQFGIGLIIVAVPGVSIKTGWTQDAALLGLNLTSNASNRELAQCRIDPMLHGFVVTYPQVAHAPLLFKQLTETNNVMLICDEVHKLGRDKAWGNAVSEAFSGAKNIITTSATPFRMDGNFIPFVRYDRDGKIISDFVRTQGENVEDGISRPLQYIALDGEISFLKDGNRYDVTFQDQLDDSLASARLNVAIGANTDFALMLLKKSYEQVLHHRKTDQKNAKWLIKCKSISHCHDVGDVVKKRFGISPVIVTEEDPDPAKTISDFGKSTDICLIGCRIIEEGVNIKAARVGTYLSNVTSRLAIDQTMGRWVRKEYLAQTGASTVFGPNEPKITGPVKTLEGIHLVTPEKEGENKKLGDEQTISHPASSLVPIQAIDTTLTGIYRGEEASAEILKIAQYFRQNYPDIASDIPEIELGKIAKALDPSLIEKVSEQRPVETFDEQRKRLERLVNTLSNRLANTLGVEYREPHSRWIKMGNPKHEASTMADLQSKLNWILEELQRASRFTSQPNRAAQH